MAAYVYKKARSLDELEAELSGEWTWAEIQTYLAISSARRVTVQDELRSLLEEKKIKSYYSDNDKKQVSGVVQTFLARSRNDDIREGLGWNGSLPSGFRQSGLMKALHQGCRLVMKALRSRRYRSVDT